MTELCANDAMERIVETLEFYADYDVRDLGEDRGALAEEALQLLRPLIPLATAKTEPPPPDGEQAIFNEAVKVVHQMLSDPATPAKEIAERVVQLRDAIHDANERFDRRVHTLRSIREALRARQH